MLRRNVLIFHSAALGDFVLTWPLAVALGRLYPQSRIIYVTSAQKGALAEKVLRLDSVDVENGWHHLFGEASSLPDACRKMLAGAHTIITFVARDADAWMTNARLIAPEAVIAPLEPRPPSDFSGHATEYLLQQFEKLPTIRTAVSQILASAAERGLGLARSGVAGAGILIHPGSGAEAKCWPPECFLRLLDKLHASKRSARIILGEAELERFPADVVRRFESAAPVVRPNTYLDLLAELSRAFAYVGNDSGPSHVSGIIGVPTLALFGPTNPAVWRPLGPRVKTLRAEPIAALPVDEVYDALTTAG